MAEIATKDPTKGVRLNLNTFDFSYSLYSYEDMSISHALYFSKWAKSLRPEFQRVEKSGMKNIFNFLSDKNKDTRNFIQSLAQGPISPSQHDKFIAFVSDEIRFIEGEL